MKFAGVSIGTVNSVPFLIGGKQMKPYIEALEEILASGISTSDRTGTGTIEKFGVTMRFNLEERFPLLTTKDMSKLFPIIFNELKWFLLGRTDLNWLIDNNVNIWTADAYRWEKAKERLRVTKKHKDNFTLDEFIQSVETTGKLHSLGNIYGKQWRNFGEVDQVKKILDQLGDVIEEKSNKEARRIMLTSYNPANQNDDLAVLPPCHVLFQIYVNNDGTLSGSLYQRSGDMFLGVPFNIASYALLLELLAHSFGTRAKELVHTIGCAHIYSNHVEQVKKQVTREVIEDKAKLVINVKPHDLREALYVAGIRYTNKYLERAMTLDNIFLEGYQSHGKLTGKVSVGDV